MADGFRSITYHRDAEGGDEESFSVLEGMARPQPPEASEAAGFENDETAARFYLDEALNSSPFESMRGLSGPDDPTLVPDMRVENVREQPHTNSRIVRFQQTQSAIPVFGSTAVVELDENRELISLDAELADDIDVSPIAALSPGAALERLVAFTEGEPEELADVAAPELNFFHDEESGAWHLAYFFRRVPATPPGYLDDMTGDDYRGHGLGNFLRVARVEMDYLVDAHDGDILFYYSANPMLDVPTKLRGADEEGVSREFWGRQRRDQFELHDPIRDIRTLDLELADLDPHNLPAEPVRNDEYDWSDRNRAAISAHVNAMRVFDFYKGEMKRDGIDDRGMQLVSVVNCTLSQEQKPPEWFNAVWWQDRMWYGQSRDQNGRLVSFARFLDVIAHELTHGVTQYTSGLVYRDQSGALNESFSDIFGIIIKNWYEVGADSDPRTWDWELGAGLGADGLPLRDLSDPARTGDPAHMDDFVQTRRDNGGVHINSNIHNKAAYNLLTAADDRGNLIMPPREVAILYYLTLTRLSSMATFAKVRQVLTNVARTFYAGDPAERERKIGAIDQAYDAVGIHVSPT